MLDEFHPHLLALGVFCGLTLAEIVARLPARSTGLPLSPTTAWRGVTASLLASATAAGLLLGRTVQLSPASTAVLALAAALGLAGTFAPPRSPSPVPLGWPAVGAGLLSASAVLTPSAGTADPTPAVVVLVSVASAAATWAGARVAARHGSVPVLSIVAGVALALWLCLPDTESAAVIGTCAAAAAVSVGARRTLGERLPFDARLPVLWGVAGTPPLLGFAMTRSAASEPTAFAAAVAIAIGAVALMALALLPADESPNHESPNHKSADTRRVRATVLLVPFVAVTAAMFTARVAGVRTTLEEAHLRGGAMLAMTVVAVAVLLVATRRGR